MKSSKTIQPNSILKRISLGSFTLFVSMLSMLRAEELDTTIPIESLLTQSVAENLSELALKCIHNDYPNKPGHVLTSDADVMPQPHYRNSLPVTTRENIGSGVSPSTCFSNLKENSDLGIDPKVELPRNCSSQKRFQSKRSIHVLRA